MRPQRGMAVVMALLLVALAASAIALVLWQQGLWWHQVEADRLRAQMRLLVDAELSWGRAQLKPGNVVALSQPWAAPLETREQGFVLRAALIDMQSRFNLNALATQNGLIDLTRLAQYRELLTALHLPPALAQSLTDWRGLRAQDRSPNDMPMAPLRTLERWETLRQVPGYSEAVMARLQPYVAVLPGDVVDVNVNTASPVLLGAMLPQVMPGALNQLPAQRASSYFRDISDFKTRLGIQSELVGLTATSSIFLLAGMVSQGPVRQGIVGLFKVEPGHTLLLWRREGVALPRSFLTQRDQDAHCRIPPCIP